MKKIHPWILNIGSGKIKVPIEDYVPLNRTYSLVNIDNNYFNSDNPDEIEKYYQSLSRDKLKFNCRYDIFEFMERTIMKFDYIFIYRFVEHISRDKLLYFIYLLSTITEKDATIDLISPNYQLLAEMILEEKPLKDPDFDKNDIIISTELFNEINDPHLNVTTPDRIKRLFEYEGRFVVIDYVQTKCFDGRDIYFRSIIRRVI